MRFIFNFFFFGILFFMIYHFFPDAFHTLVGWADKTYIFLRDIVLQVIDKMNGLRSTSTAPAPTPVPVHTLLHFFW